MSGATGAGGGLEVLLKDRSNARFLAPPRATLAVQRYSWTAIGGPEECEIRATGSAEALWEFVEMLRCPVEVLDAHGDCLWFGFISTVDLQVNAFRVAVSLDSLANKVAVAYAYVPAGSATTGTRATTAWAYDEASIAEYGTFELLESSSSEETASATHLRDTLLAEKRLPAPVPTITRGQQGFEAVLTCRGWWDMLSRRYYENAGTNLVETTTQIRAIAGACGEFVANVDVETPSGVSSSEYRDGDTTAQAEIEGLLQVGAASNRRLLAVVTRERWLRISEEPERGPRDYWLLEDGRLRDWLGVPVKRGVCPVGVWARPNGFIPGTVDLSYVLNMPTMFIERAEWSEGDQVLDLTFRGAAKPFVIGGVTAG